MKAPPPPAWTPWCAVGEGQGVDDGLWVGGVGLWVGVWEAVGEVVGLGGAVQSGAASGPLAGPVPGSVPGSVAVRGGALWSMAPGSAAYGSAA